MALEKEHPTSGSRSIRQLRSLSNPELDKLYSDKGTDELTRLRIGIELGRRHDALPINVGNPDKK